MALCTLPSPPDMLLLGPLGSVPRTLGAWQGLGVSGDWPGVQVAHLPNHRAGAVSLRA